MMAVALSRTYQYTQAVPKGAVKEYHLFKTAAMITNIPRLKIPTRGIFFDKGIWIRMNIGTPSASMSTSEEILKTAFVIKWLTAVSH